MSTQPPKPIEIILLRPKISATYRDVPLPNGSTLLTSGAAEVVTHHYRNGYLTRSGGRTPKWYVTNELPIIKHFTADCSGWPDFENMGLGYIKKADALAVLA